MNTVIEYNCKICRKPGKVELAPDQVCDSRWLEIFKKMLVCNPCHDLREKFRTAEEQIMRTCSMLNRMALTHPQKEEREAIISKCRIALISSTRRYADAMKVYRRLGETVWSLDLVEQLIEKPGHAFAVLKAYRDDLKNIPKQSEFLETRPVQADP
jgi:hypothetical protein